jgi:AcrR family transcriptional regulator
MTKELATDRRILRTRLAIHAAFVALVKEKGFDALSVKDITTRANINRGTFYLHYKDKYDLLEQIEAGIIQDLQGIIQQASALDVVDSKILDEPLPVMVEFFEYLRDNASLMHAVLGLRGDIAFQTRLKQAIEANISNIGFFAPLKDENLLVPREYFLSYIISAHLGVIQLWLQKGCQESPGKMALILSRLSFRGPFYASGITVEN